MKNIKELFYGFVTKPKIRDYYRHNDSVAKKKYLSNNELRVIEATKKINNHMIFFHYFETIVKKNKTNSQEFIAGPARSIYFLGCKLSSRNSMDQILQNLPNIYWAEKNKLYACIVKAFKPASGSNVKQIKVNKRQLLVHPRLFHRVNFLSEKINGYALSSVFLWTTPVYIANNVLSDEILHLFGVYKNQDKKSLSIELRFAKITSAADVLLKEFIGCSNLSRRKIKENTVLKIRNRKGISLISFSDKKRYSIIVHGNNLTGRDNSNFSVNEMKLFITDIIENLKYYR